MVTAGMLPRAAVREVEAACAPQAARMQILTRPSCSGWQRAGMPALLMAPLGAEQAAKLEALTARRAAREPLQYLCGSWPFLDFELAVGPGVLCPRADTEVVAEAAAGCWLGWKHPGCWTSVPARAVWGWGSSASARRRRSHVWKRALRHTAIWSRTPISPRY